MVQTFTCIRLVDAFIYNIQNPFGYIPEQLKLKGLVQEPNSGAKSELLQPQSLTTHHQAPAGP